MAMTEEERKASKKASGKKYSEANKEKIKAYREANKEKIKAQRLTYREANREKESERSNKWYKEKENKEKARISQKARREANKEEDAATQKAWRKNNKERVKCVKKAHYEANKKEILARNNAYTKKRRATDPLFKLRLSLSNCVRRALREKGIKKGSRLFKILGCDYETFIKYITGKFTEGMTLENHGEWHLDHKYPLALAVTIDDVILLNYYENFQPMWGPENEKKSAKCDLTMDEVRKILISLKNKTSGKETTDMVLP